MPSLAHLFGTSLDGADWPLVLADDASLLHALDASMARACAAQSKRLDLHALPNEDIQELHDDTRVVFALYMRLLSELEATPLKQATQSAMHVTLLHVARLVPFCQLFALRNSQRVRSLLDAALTNVDNIKADLAQLPDFYAKQLEHIHVVAGQNKRAQVVDLIQRVYEVSLSIHALSLSRSATDVIFGGSEDQTLATGSLVRTLAVCYEADIPVLQRGLSKLDEAAQKKAALLIPESRRILLRVLDTVFQAAMEREKAAAGTGEGVLMIIHELSHSTDAEMADHGSFISDLWHLCSYEAKLLEFFDDIKLDRDSVSYLEVILEGLPRRRVLVEADQKLSKQTAPASVEGTDVAPTSAQMSVSDSASKDLTALISQVQDLFPDLGDGYVALCLLCSQHELETVINYLLESNPPPVVRDVRRDLKRCDSEYAALERKAFGNESLTESATSAKSEKVDPSRIWKGKRSQEKHYDPQVARKDPSIVEKVMQIVDEYAEEENFRETARLQAAGKMGGAETGYNSTSEVGIMLDEYDDDYNDEFEDYEPFSVHDGGQTEDFDAIRLQNRRMRELEAEDAFWEGMRNQNRRAVDVDEENDDAEDEDDESKEQTPSQWSRGPARGEWKPRSGDIANASRPRGGPPRRGADAATGQPMSEQQVQRQRQRDNKNKAKVGNHHRKDRALKKRG